MRRHKTPRANGETVGIQNYASTTGNMHAIIAREKGFCEKYNFKCEIKTINSTSLGLQALVGKTIDFTQGGADLVGAAVVAGADVVIVGTSLPANVLSISVRNDVTMPNRDKGYPAIMNDFKGKKIGVAARGTSSEKYFNAMLKDGGPEARGRHLRCGRRAEHGLYRARHRQADRRGRSCTSRCRSSARSTRPAKW